jgi:hypothetical protein
LTVRSGLSRALLDASGGQRAMSEVSLLDRVRYAL